MTTVAEHFAHILKAHGIEKVFGLPGGASLPLLAALQRHGIDFVLVRHESSAVYMADVTARLSGKPGVVITTLGPGATNALAGVSHAYLDRAPILIVTGDFPESILDRHTHQALDLQTVFAPMVKQTARLRPATAVQQMQEALALTVAGRPGPVQLSLALADADAETTPGETRRPARDTVEPTRGRHTEIAEAMRLIEQAERPVIVAGLGLEPERPYAALRQLAEATGSPVIDTPKSKGAIPATHPLCAGTIGLMQSDPAYAILDEADCIIAVGFDIVELVRLWDSECPLIWMAPWANKDAAITATVQLVGGMAGGLLQLARQMPTGTRGWGVARVDQLRRNLATRPLPAPTSGRMLPQQVLTCLARVLPAETAVTTDVGSHKILTALQWPAQKPNRYMVSNGLSAMGYGLPAAIAAAAYLEQTAVCITGDAGFAMALGELALINELACCVIIVVMNDAALDLIRAKQLRRDEPIFGTEFSNPAFDAIADAYGLDYRQVQDEASCEAALRLALTGKRSLLLEALIDPSSYPTAPGQAGRP